MKFAVIQTGGKQYKVKEGDKVRVEKLAGVAGDALKFNEILLKAEGDKIEIGAPFVKGAAVETEILGQVRDDKDNLPLSLQNEIPEIQDAPPAFHGT